MQPMAALNHTRKNLLRFQEKLGIDSVDVEETRWTFWGAVFYCMTVYTTIGYGNVVPGTTAGRVLTILYAFVGIPFAVLTLFALGGFFAKLCKSLWKMVLKSTTVVSKDLERKVTDAVGFEDGAQASKSTSSSNDDDILSFPISFLIFLTILWVFFCALIFSLLEDWSYGLSLYFTLISFTTIGFGDVLPSEYDHIVIIGFLLLIGLSLVSTVLTLIQQQIEALTSGVQENIDREYMNALVEAAEHGEIPEDFKKMKMNSNNSEEALPMQNHEVDNRSLEAILSRMPLKERLLYRVMPTSAKNRLVKQSQLKMSRRNRATQTDVFLLQTLLYEEILKMELNNELPSARKMSSSPSRHVTSGANIKGSFPTSTKESIPKSSDKTTTLREDEV
ncbi:Ion channel [Dictyocaulus viviparus]|uniref:Ion channel n=1 Tax=Dictyocaulus viviparus TaxID=29172 RepID=A0A0D8XYE6_DICVI|nr:Ion channel [Dictyocaulus viviparus]